MYYLFFNCSKHQSSFHLVSSEEKWAVQRKIHLFKYCNTLPRDRNLEPKFEFQTPLARNSLAGTSELIPFGANSGLCWNFPSGTSDLLPFSANSDLPWDWRFLVITSQGFLFALPYWGLLWFTFVGNYIFPRWGFTMLIISWGTTYNVIPIGRGYWFKH